MTKEAACKCGHVSPISATFRLECRCTVVDFTWHTGLKFAIVLKRCQNRVEKMETWLREQFRLDEPEVT